MKQLRVAGLVAALSLVAAACTTGATDDPPSEPVLVILDQDSRVVIVEPDGNVIERYDPSPDGRYVQPIWSSRDTVIRSQIAPNDNRLTATRIGGEEVWSVELATPPFYYLASPDEQSTTVISLRNNETSTGLIAELISGSESVDAISDEAPFYMTWEPNGDRLAAHIGAERLEINYGRIETVLESTGGYQAPLWLERGLVTLRTQGESTFLSVWDGSSFVNLGIVRGGARFVGTGDRIAIQTGPNTDNGGIQAMAQSVPTIPAGVLTVVDLGSGSLTSVTSLPSPVYQWDPSGSLLLFSTLVNDPEPALVWHVWGDGDIRDFEPYAPDPSWFQSFVPFFDQYAQSVSLWSPDGSAFAYPAIVNGEPRILVQELNGAAPRDIAGGVWVAWAP